jgi:2-dehydro-3-deoxyphosphogluconate aldolase/(4S)-4-hydroxy-2-oxoglutarate aldolase
MKWRDAGPYRIDVSPDAHIFTSINLHARLAAVTPAAAGANQPRMRMEGRSQILDAILRNRLIAVVRLDDAARAIEVVEAIAAGGITTIEITLTTPGAIELVEELAPREDLLVGAGTVLSPRDAVRAFAAGALFYASPVTDPGLISAAHAAGRLAMPGALTPNEIVAADRAGADLIKIFPMPADAAPYLRSIGGPLRELRLAPSGGVTPDTAASLLEAGAAALNVGTWLTSERSGRLLSLEEITSRAARLVECAGKG